MDWSDIRVLYLRELRSALRERNIVINSILIPILLYPLLLWLIYTGGAFVSGQTEGFTSRVALKDFPDAHRALRAGLEAETRFEIKSSEDPETEIRRGTLDALVEFLPPDPQAASLGRNFSVRILYDKSKERSDSARNRILDQISRYRERYLQDEAKEVGLSAEQFQQFWVEGSNVATSRQMGQFILGLILPMFLIIMLSVGGLYPAIDCTAGERENSTWETLMTVATSRANIVVAKYLYVATMSFVAGMLNLIAMTFSMRSILRPLMGDGASELSFQIPLVSIPVILVGAAFLALFIAAGMMILASFARTFKEGQSMVGPFYIAIFLPLLFLQIPELTFTPLLAAIPVVNVTMVFREAMAGTFNWPLIGLTLAAESACVILALWLATTILSFEDFVIGSYGGSLSKFVKERLVPGKRGVGAKA